MTETGDGAEVEAGIEGGAGVAIEGEIGVGIGIVKGKRKII